jgi:putative DNA primase/helicase
MMTNETTGRKVWSELLLVAERTQHSQPPAATQHTGWTPDLDSIGVADLNTASHDDLALDFARAHEYRIRYIPQRKAWAKWTGHRWEVDPAGNATVKELLRAHMRPIARKRAEDAEDSAMHARGATPADGRRAYTSTYKALMSHATHLSILGFAESDGRLVTPLSAFDANPYVLNTPGGLVDLRTGEVSEPSAAALVMRSTVYAPDFTMPTPLWDNFIRETYQGDTALIEFVQRMLGVSLLGAQAEQVLLYMLGTGANGKDTFANIVEGELGTGPGGYAVTVDSNMLVSAKYQGHPTEIAQLAGARMAVTSEVPPGAEFDVAKVKKLTGGGLLSGRFMRGDFFEFEATATLWIMANDRLAVPATDKAFFRRLREVPFNNVVPPEERISGLDKTILAQEGPGVLAWMIEGARKYLAEGLDVPLAVQMANEAYAAEQDTVQHFIDDACSMSVGAFTPSADLYRSYVQWCSVHRVTPLSAPKFRIKALASPGVTPHRSNTSRGYSGISIGDAYNVTK